MKTVTALQFGLIMGIWVLLSSAENYAAEFLGHCLELTSEEDFFVMISAIAFTGGLAMLLILKSLKRAMKPERGI